MIKIKRIYGIEFTVITLLWFLVIISPLIFMRDFDYSWRAVHVMWAECIVVGVIFLINRFFLMPRLFFAKKYIAYIASVAGILLLLMIFIFYFDIVNIIVSIFGDYDTLSSVTPPRVMSPHPHIAPEMGGFEPNHIPPSVPEPQAVTAIPPSVSILITSALVMALDLGIRIASTWLITEQRQAAINRERMVSQLQNLQSQVSPHFFMNTLNNIHALVDIDSARAKQTIIELSDLMSYLLYDCSNKNNISLQKELNFIINYINLMRLRFSEQVKISFVCNNDIPAVKIPPLLFLNFIENAFKYGVDYEHESYVDIMFRFTQSEIALEVQNSNHSSTVRSSKHGLGLTNSRKRLDLIYGTKYSLDISNQDKIYSITLKIPIQ